jgi:hypothetical protein
MIRFELYLMGMPNEPRPAAIIDAPTALRAFRLARVHWFRNVHSSRFRIERAA